mmetsp:Transcript_13868/g.34245  ORF Transcript_13868/g.34245 Transcript_13868/m.34245 type:complete len:84 (-) Transcript_13868:369-620(-)
MRLRRVTYQSNLLCCKEDQASAPQTTRTASVTRVWIRSSSSSSSTSSGSKKIKLQLAHHRVRKKMCPQFNPSTCKYNLLTGAV